MKLIIRPKTIARTTVQCLRQVVLSWCLTLRQRGFFFLWDNLVCLVYFVSLVSLVSLVYLVDLVCLVIESLSNWVITRRPRSYPQRREADYRQSKAQDSVKGPAKDACLKSRSEYQLEVHPVRNWRALAMSELSNGVNQYIRRSVERLRWTG